MVRLKKCKNNCVDILATAWEIIENIGMKILFYIIISLALIIIVALIMLSVASRKQPVLGLIEQQLRACPQSTNCVCSERPDEKAFIEPLAYSTTAEDAWHRLKLIIIETGGKITAENEGYLHAQYVTPLMRFVDDVELRLDSESSLIHIRSASRVGKSDLGANRQRVERIRSSYRSENSS